MFILVRPPIDKAVDGGVNKYVSHSTLKLILQRVRGRFFCCEYIKERPYALNTIDPL